MTYRSASSNWATHCKLLGSCGVLAASLFVGLASGQEEQSGRSSDRSSGQDESTRRREQTEDSDQTRSSDSQSDQQRRRREAQSANQERTQSAQRSSSGQSSQNQYGQQSNQYGQRSNPYGQQSDRFGQGQSDRNQQQRFGRSDERSANGNERSRQSAREDQYGSERGGQQASNQPSDAAWLGVYLRESQTNENGAQVTQVYPAGPAARAGLRAGDVITAVDGQSVSSTQELISAIEEHQPGARAQLSLTRNNQRIEVPITLGSRQSFAWNRNENWSGPQFGGESGYASTSRSGNEDFRSSHGGDDDYWSNVPPFAMQLEHERRMYEQHQRIETQIAQLQQEVRQLREELRQQRR